MGERFIEFDGSVYEVMREGQFKFLGKMEPISCMEGLVEPELED